VQERVVVAAEKDQVVESGFATVGPVDDVVNVAPAGISSATGMLAMPVTGHHGAAQARVHDSGFPSDVEDF
jgi:hypothetical protein